MQAVSPATQLRWHLCWGQHEWIVSPAVEVTDTLTRAQADFQHVWDLLSEQSMEVRGLQDLGHIVTPLRPHQHLDQYTGVGLRPVAPHIAITQPPE
eukprot:748290-Rhodomonas_salina.3